MSSKLWQEERVEELLIENAKLQEQLAMSDSGRTLGDAEETPAEMRHRLRERIMMLESGNRNLALEHDRQVGVIAEMQERITRLSSDNQRLRTQLGRLSNPWSTASQNFVRVETEEVGAWEGHQYVAERIVLWRSTHGTFHEAMAAGRQLARDAGIDRISVNIRGVVDCGRVDIPLDPTEGAVMSMCCGREIIYSDTTESILLTKDGKACRDREGRLLEFPTAEDAADMARVLASMDGVTRMVLDLSDILTDKTDEMLDAVRDAGRTAASFGLESLLSNSDKVVSVENKQC